MITIRNAAYDRKQFMGTIGYRRSHALPSDDAMLRKAREMSANLINHLEYMRTKWVDARLVSMAQKQIEMAMIIATSAGAKT